MPVFLYDHKKRVIHGEWHVDSDGLLPSNEARPIWGTVAGRMVYPL